jgi:hypothetical protein
MVRPACALGGLGIFWIVAVASGVGCGLSEVGTEPGSDDAAADTTLDIVSPDDSAAPPDTGVESDTSPTDVATDVPGDVPSDADGDASTDVAMDTAGDVVDAGSDADADAACTGVICNSQCIAACVGCPGQPALCLASNRCQADCTGCGVISCLVCADGGPAEGGALVCDRNFCINGGYAHCSCNNPGDCQVPNQTCTNNACATCGESNTDNQDCEQGQQGCTGNKRQQCNKGLETCMCN